MTSSAQITSRNPPNGVEYSSVCSWNCDQSYLLLLASALPAQLDHFALYDGDGNFLRDLPIGASTEPRWSQTDRNIFYFIEANILKDFDVKIGGAAPVFTFKDYVSISGKGESDISLDGDHFVFLGTKADGTQDVLIYSVKAGIVEHYPQTLPIDGLKITSSNKAIISRSSDPAKPTDGIYILETTGERQLTAKDEHACPAVYIDRDVLLWAEADTINACVMIDIETGARTVLSLQLPWDYSIHISAPVGLPWCIVSIDCPDKKLPAQVWKVYFDTSIPSELICEPGSVFNGYASEIKASVARDGSRLVGCSNFGKTADPNYCDVFLVRFANLEGSMNLQTVRIDYAPYVGKSRFKMVVRDGLILTPRPDGACDISGIVDIFSI